MKQIAVVGTQGIPAEYGGFETLVENIVGNHSSPGIAYTVFCSGKDIQEKIPVYKGANLRYVPLHANGIQSILYDTVSLFKAMKGSDAILMLGTSGGIFLPVFRLFYRKKLIVNIDGSEHRRKKWKKPVRWFLRLSEAVAVRFSDTVIADNKGIRDYVYKTYRKEAELIAYGGDHALRNVSEEFELSVLKQYNLIPGQYALSVCRIEPENHCHITLEAFSGTNERLLFIGNWAKNNYGKKLKRQYETLENITIHEPMYDLDTLYVLRKHAEYYIHGHSAGGTNPSLVEAMFCRCNIIAYDVIFNRETTENSAHYFRDVQELKLLLAENKDVSNARAMYEIARRRYTWAVITRQYENLY